MRPHHSRDKAAKLLTRDEKMYQGLAKLAVMKLHVSYPGDTAQLPDCFRPTDRLGDELPKTIVSLGVDPSSGDLT
jgi:hypothetical protein